MNTTTPSASPSLSQKIQEFEYHPEVYVYPTPRMYESSFDFSLEEVVFTSDVNVYAHIPFCKQICTFCGYLKMIDTKQAWQDTYVDALIKEIDMFGDVLADKKIQTLHYGGGTPSLLTPLQLEKIMNALLKNNSQVLNTSKEVSIEATPESINYSKFLAYKNLGINRVSMGVQSLDDEEIKLSKRNNSSDVSLRAIETLHEVGISNVVIDLMIGIEGQTISSFEKTVKKLIKYRPETVEFYALGIMPHTVLSKKTSLSSLMHNKDIYDCYEIGNKLFLEAGYVQDAHNRYIISGKGSFFQEDFVFEDQSLLGFGAGARSYATNMHYRNTYYSKNHKRAVAEYVKNINSKNFAVASKILLSPEEKMRQYSIYNLEALDMNDFRSTFGVDFSTTFSLLYDDLLSLDLVKQHDQTLLMTPKGLLFRDLISKQFFSDEVNKMERAYRPA